MDTEELVEVYTTTQELEAEVIRGRLDAEGIGATVSGASQGGFTGVLEVKVYVKACDEQRARDIIEEGEEQKLEGHEDYDLGDEDDTEEADDEDQSE